MIFSYKINNLLFLNKESLNSVGYELTLYVYYLILIKFNFVSLTMLFRIVVINW